MEAPFWPGTFDLIIISAALHHICNITDALRIFRSLLSRNGKIVLLREPCAVVPDAPAYIQELESGFNEQQFELAEYDEMFRRTGFHPVYAQIDYDCSYKVILEIDQGDFRSGAGDETCPDAPAPPREKEEIHQRHHGFIRRFCNCIRRFNG
jgi:SAM-dependent methyltransferase